MRLQGGVRLVNGPSMENVRRLDMGAMSMILSMQRNGVLIDVEYFAKFSKELGQDMDRLTEQVRKMTGFYINVASPDQVADLLFSKMKLKPPPGTKKTPTGKRYKMDDEVMISMAHVHEVVPVIIDFRERDKLKDSFVDVLPILRSRDGRVRGNVRATRVVTGRLSMTEPNLLAIPIRTELGKRVRAGFIAGPGRVLLTCDLSQIEMRTVADDAKCERMINIFKTGGDIHSETASGMFDLPIDRLDPMEHRYPAKRVGFGVLFGITGEGLMDQMAVSGAKGWTVDRCEEMISRWYGVYPEILEWKHLQHSRIRRYMMNWCRFGRPRWVPEIKSVHRWIQDAGLREGVNHRIQATAQGIIKVQMAILQQEIDEIWGDAVWPLLQIHDELLFEVSEHLAEEFGYSCQQIMSGGVPLSVPIKAKAVWGPDWGSL